MAVSRELLGHRTGARYGFPKAGLLKLGQPDEVVVDLFSYHPADYAIAGGAWGVEGGWPSDPGARGVHHNVMVAGPNAVSVDAAGAAIMGNGQARPRVPACSRGLNSWSGPPKAP
jgi:uncharacterized protein (DUF362 family)